MTARQKDWLLAYIIALAGILVCAYIVLSAPGGISEETQRQIDSCRALGGHPVLSPLAGRTPPGWFLNSCELGTAK